MTDQQLAAELALPAYAGKTAEQKVAALNAAKPGYFVPRIVDVGTILGVLGAAPFRISQMSEPNKTAWLQVLANIRSLKEGFNPSDPTVAPLLAQGVTDGAITAGERLTLESLGLRPGSRAEELWGEGTVVSLNDVARVS